MRQNTLCLVAAALAAGFIGCTGGAGHYAPTQGMATAPAQYAGQVAMQPDRPIHSPVFGQPNVPQPSPFGTVTHALTNNPLTTAVSQTYSAMQPQPAPPSPHGTASVLSLSNQRQTATPSLYVAMGRLAERNESYDQASMHYQKALELAPNDVDALLAYGRFYDRRNQHDEAIRLYDRAVRANPEHAPAHNDLGLCLARKGDLAAAAASLTQATQLQPHRKLYRNNLATVLVELGRKDEAIAQLTTVHPPAIAHYNMGVLVQKQGDDAAAAEYFATALRLDPSMDAAKASLNKLHGPVDVPASYPIPDDANTPVYSTGTDAAATSPVVVRPAQPAADPPGRVSAVPFSSLPPAVVQPLPTILPEVRAVNPVAPQVSAPVQSPAPPAEWTPPVPQYTPDYPSFPPQPSAVDSRYSYPSSGASAQFPAGPLGGNSTAWPLQQPSQVPSIPNGLHGAQPPVPAVVTNVFATPTPLPPVRQASAPTGYPSR